MNKIPQNITIEQLQERLREAHEQIGFHGRFTFTIDQSGKANWKPSDPKPFDPKAMPECFITHWFRPTPYSFEDCKVVGSGTVAECWVALENFVDEKRRGQKAEADRKETAIIRKNATCKLTDRCTTEETAP